MIGIGKEKNLSERMKELGIIEKNLKEKFIRSSGKGGQNVNKVNSCVWIKDEVSGFEVKCQKTRSQQDNRYFARLILCEKLEAKIHGKKSAEAKRRYKIKKQKQKRSRRAKQKMLDAKKKRGDRKKLRNKPQW